MIQLIRPSLTITHNAQLREYQRTVDACTTFSAKVRFAKDDFSTKNVVGNAVFDHVKSKLKEMCSGAERCHYCEDSAVDQVEHFYPKDAYPECCYDWNNYFYVCGPCNRKKNNKCAIINAQGQLIDVTPPKTKAHLVIDRTPPVSGRYAYVNTENENPLDFFMLDIFNGTFALVENPHKQGVDLLRATYTLEQLDIGRKRVLCRARQKAYQDFLNALEAYWFESQVIKPDKAKLKRIIACIKEANHQTVWQEMKRQKDLIPELSAIFGKLPVALGW